MTVKFRDIEFQIKDYSYAVINAYAPALKKLDILEEEYTKDIDTTEYDKHLERLRNLSTSVEQTKDVPEKKDYHEGQKKKLEEALNGLVKFNRVIERIENCKKLAKAEWMTDIDIQRPAIEKILIGDKSKIVWESEEAGELIQKCGEFFFQIFNLKKLQ